VLGLLWASCLLQVLTSAPNRPFTLLEPWTTEWWVVLASFLLTSTALLVPRPRILWAAHLAVVAFIFLEHPLSSVFGRDGALAAIGLYGVALVARSGIRAELKLVAPSLLVGAFLVEAALSASPDPSRPRAGLLDYGDLMGECGAGGCLKPALDVPIVSERGIGRFVTNRLGFRTAADVVEPKPGGLLRVLLVGDSFVAGYRMDQDDTLAQRLAVELQPFVGPLQVLAAELPHPEAARAYVAAHAARFEPDMIVVGLTVGNDIAQAWSVRRRVPEPVIASLLLPADGFDNSMAHRVRTKFERSLRSWRVYGRLSRALRPAAITTDYPDSPGRVHVFDSMNGLGLFYARRPLPLLEQAFAELRPIFAELSRAARDAHASLLIVLFPQRFQISAAEWNAAVAEYGLDLAAFDLTQANRRIALACSEAGVECLDLLPAFRSEPGQTYLPLGDMHWSARGHALAARTLAPAVATRLRSR
jgi:acetyltransferase AlgX (SGNH hydrolase-like protein)